MDAAAAARPSRIDIASILSRALGADLARPWPFAALASAFLAARVPLLGYGSGTDPDAWRVALTGHYLMDQGKYFPSRLPGNPLHELLLAPLSPGGWVAANLATALASLAGVYLFALIVRRLDLPGKGLLTVAFAFTPLMFINSVATMDYMWALTCILGAYYAAMRGLPLWAGLLCGAAAGFRLAGLVAVVPVAYLVLRTSSWRQVVPFGLAAFGAAALAFTPVLAVYGTRAWNFYDAPVPFQVVVRLLGKEALGVSGGLAVLAGIAFSLRRLRALPGDALRDPHLGAWLLLIAVFTASFLRLPHEIAYMLPVFPFGYFILGKYLKPAVMAAVVAVILAAGLVDITTPGDGMSLSDVASARVGKGLLLSNIDTMKNQRDFVADVLRAEVPDHSVVITGFVFPQLAYRERDRLDVRILQRDYGAISMLADRGEAVDRERDIRYVWLLTYDAFLALRSQGYRFFIVPDAAGGTAALYDYRPGLFGATFLPLQSAAPSAGKGTASTDR